MEVINTYLVEYKESYADGCLAALYEFENGTYKIGYEIFDSPFDKQIVKPIDKETAEHSIINFIK